MDQQQGEPLIEWLDPRLVAEPAHTMRTEPGDDATAELAALAATDEAAGAVGNMGLALAPEGFLQSPLIASRQRRRSLLLARRTRRKLWLPRLLGIEPGNVVRVLIATFILFGIVLAIIGNYREGIPARVFVTNVHKMDPTHTKGMTDADLLVLGRTACIDVAQNGSKGFQAGVERMASTVVGERIAWATYHSAVTYLCPQSRFAGWY